LSEGLVDRAAIVDEGIRLRDASRANAVVLVERPGGGGLALKLAAPERLEREEEVHRLAAARPRLAAALPVRLGGDAAAGWLARELVWPGETLLSAHRRGAGFPVDVARALGAAVGAWHADTGDVRLGDGGPHWALSALDPDGPAAFAWADEGLRAVLAAAPAALEGALAGAREAWGASCLVHGDLKWDNCLLADGRVFVVDWESAATGDPAWDLAGVVQEYLARAELSGLEIGGARPLAALRVAGSTELGAALAACMEAYCAAAGADRAPLARRAVAFAGARLVQTGLEHASAAGHAEAAAPLLRLALVLLERSGEAAAALRLDGAAT
jgi:hypothetical protein